MHPSPRVIAIPVYDPVYYDTGKLNGPHRRPEGGQLPGLLHRTRPGQQRLRPHHADLGPHQGHRLALRRPARSPKPFVSWSSSPWRSSPPSSSHSDEDFRREHRPACCERAACPSVCSKAARRAEHVHRRTLSSSTSAATRPRGMAAIERLRAESRRRRDLRRRPGDRSRADPPGDACRRQRVLHVAGARGLVPGGRPAHRRAPRDRRTRTAKPPSSTLVFFGAKGGAGTTTVAVNCAVELARLTKRPTVIVDLKPGFGEVALFLGVRPRFTVLDAIENLHRLDKDFLHELCAKHKSGLEILAGSEQFERPGSQDAGAIEELFRVLGKSYDYIGRRCRQPHQLVQRRRALRGRHDLRRREPGRALGAQRAAAGRSRPAARRRRRADSRPAEPGVRSAHDRAQADRDRARLRHAPHVPERLQDRVHRAQLRRAAGADEQLGDRRAVRQLHAPDHLARRSRREGRRREEARRVQLLVQLPEFSHEVAMSASAPRSP